ncbi:right-handed parallel beta-helix repeat-containing protein [Roseateles sp. PN1]|uniref:right-handed parallel beta-helix repeat-containing protein n=1 Tax=Roseateles sp. PN1 TaxID=3137372 RepID=UPI0031396815
MSVVEETPIASSVANGATSVFPYSFTVLNAADLKVQGELNGVKTIYTLGVDYTLSGVGSGSGSVNFLANPAAGTVITRYRDTALIRTTDYQNNGDLLAGALNGDMDRLWLVLQEIYGGGKGAPTSLRVPNGETVPALAAAGSRANRVLAFDSSGNPITIPGVDSGSAAALALDLANGGNSTKASGQIAFNGSLPYPDGSLGAEVRRKVYAASRGASPSKTAAQNTAILQPLLDAMTAGDALVFTSGDWPINTLYVQNDRVSVIGEGDATLVLQGNTDGLVVGVTGSMLSFCDVVGLKFDRAAKSTDGAAVKMVNTAYSSVRRCGFRNSYKGIWVKTHNDSLLIDGNVFYDGTYYGIYENNINETWANDLRICHNYFWHVEYAALFMTADGVGVASVGDTYFHHNVIVSSPSKGALQTKHAVRVEGAGTYNTNVRVEQNVMEGLRNQFVWMVGLNRSPVIGNYFSGTGTNDVGLYYGSGTGNSQIGGNTFIGFNSSGAFIFSTGGISFCNNHFTANATLGGATAELTMQSVQDVMIDTNFFSSASSKWCIDLSGTTDQIIITSNRFSKSGANANYALDIRLNFFGSNRRIQSNLGNDVTSGAGTSSPVAGSALQWYQGDRIENKAPSELGTSPNKYTINGWICTIQGDPGTWQQQRMLTGN